MKYFYLFIGLIFLTLILVLFFQLYAGANLFVPFFTKWIEIKKWTLIILVFSFLAGTFVTLGIKGFTSGSNDIDDDFDL